MSGLKRYADEHDEDDYEYGIMEVLEPEQEPADDEKETAPPSDAGGPTSEEEKKPLSGYTADHLGRVFTKFDELDSGNSTKIRRAPGEGVAYQTDLRKAQIILKNKEMGMYDGPGKRPLKRGPKEDPMFKSLNLILFAARGEMISVELKNDTKVVGRLEEVDTAMNLVLTNRTEEGHESETYVKGDTVRYVRFPREFKIGLELKHMKQVQEEKKDAKERATLLRFSKGEIGGGVKNER